MDAHQEAMLKALVAVAWADGKLDAKEQQVVDALCAAFDVTGADAQNIREFAKTAKTLKDVPSVYLAASDRRSLLQHAVIVTFADGEQTEKEITLLHQLAHKLDIGETEATELIEAASDRAKRLVGKLS